MLEKLDRLKSSYDFKLKCNIDNKQVTTITFHKGCPHSKKKDSFSVDISFFKTTGTSFITDTELVLNSISTGVPFDMELEIGYVFHIDPIEVKIIN